jgi:tetratricopeptide (TPR) repeat protein
LEGVERVCQDVLRAQPNQVKALYLLGAGYHELGRLDEALRHFDRILRVCPASARAHHARGSVLRDQLKLDEAVRSFQQGARLRPRFLAVRISLAMALQEQGSYEEAEASFREVLRLRPELPEAHVALAITLEAQGKLDEAVAAYRQALFLDPQAAAVHNNLGALLLKQSKIAEAGVAITEALRLRPNFAEAHCNLGALRQRRRQLDAALDCYKRALDLEPSLVAAHQGLAAALLEDGQPQAARACVQATLRLRPNLAEAHATLGKILLQEGEREAAVASFRAALRCDPNCVAALGAAAFFGVCPLSDAELDRIQTLLAKPGLPATDASRLHFGVGSLKDRAGAYDEAFAHFALANDFRRAVLREEGSAFDARSHRAWVEKIVAACDAAYFARTRGLGLGSERPVFIVGMPRSGTTLVEQILSSHPDVHGAGELRDINRLAEELPARLGGLAEYPACLKRLDGGAVAYLADKYLERLARLNDSVRRVTDKMPLNFLHLGLIAALFPRARVIHCVRDPFDVCLSCYFQDFGGVNFSSDLADLGNFYRDYERLMAHWGSVLPLPTFDVIYEELVGEPEAVSRRLVSFCGLEWDDRCLTFHQNRRAVHTASQMQVRQPVYKKSVGRWRHYAAHLQPLFDALQKNPCV